MFYSQFILAKKGPLGTIWIAAHLERKLRKNQVAETDIGSTVDNILFPEVPIALRLSGHLLLGVVRIYSRQVNYLFNDCSETLGKIKQAFHSAAVDLPPEATTAPFHSITLPETFDFDELELGPDSESSFLHSKGKYVDHHVTTREQITLQDSIDQNPYLGSSQFGLDERFGDGSYSSLGFDFDEEFWGTKAGSSAGASTSTLLLQEDIIPPTAGGGNEVTHMDVDDPHEQLLELEQQNGKSIGEAVNIEAGWIERDKQLKTSIGEAVNTEAGQIESDKQLNTSIGEAVNIDSGQIERDDQLNTSIGAVNTEVGQIERDNQLNTSIGEAVNTEVNQLNTSIPSTSLIPSNEPDGLETPVRNDSDFVVFRNETPVFHAYTPRILEASTPDLNQEYCPPAQPSTPALANEIFLPIHKDCNAESAGRFLPVMLGNAERISSSELLTGGSLPSQQVSFAIPPASSVQATSSPSTASFQGFPLQQVTPAEMNREASVTQKENGQALFVKENVASASTAFQSFMETRTLVPHEGAVLSTGTVSTSPKPSLPSLHQQKDNLSVTANHQWAGRSSQEIHPPFQEQGLEISKDLKLALPSLHQQKDNLSVTANHQWAGRSSQEIHPPFQEQGLEISSSVSSSGSMAESSVSQLPSTMQNIGFATIQQCLPVSPQNPVSSSGSMVGLSISQPPSTMRNIIRQGLADSTNNPVSTFGSMAKSLVSQPPSTVQNMGFATTQQGLAVSPQNPVSSFGSMVESFISQPPSTMRIGVQQGLAVSPQNPVSSFGSMPDSFVSQSLSTMQNNVQHGLAVSRQNPVSSIGSMAESFISQSPSTMRSSIHQDLAVGAWNPVSSFGSMAESSVSHPPSTPQNMGFATIQQGFAVRPQNMGFTTIQQGLAVRPQNPASSFGSVAESLISHPPSPMRKMGLATVQQGLAVNPQNSVPSFGSMPESFGSRPPSTMQNIVANQVSTSPIMPDPRVSPLFLASSGSLLPMASVPLMGRMEKMDLNKEAAHRTPNSAAVSKGQLCQSAAPQVNLPSSAARPTVLLPSSAARPTVLLPSSAARPTILSSISTGERETLRSAYDSQRGSSDFLFLQNDMSVERIPGLESERNKSFSVGIDGIMKQTMLPALDNTPILREETPYTFTRAPFLSTQSRNSLPADDDVLASILGGRSKAFEVVSTPKAAAEPNLNLAKRPKRVPRVTPKKRKIDLDIVAVLHGDVIRQQLANAEDIRRDRCKAPCTRREVWAFIRESEGQENFDEPTLPELSSNLHELYHDVLHGPESRPLSASLNGALKPKQASECMPIRTGGSDCLANGASIGVSELETRGHCDVLVDCANKDSRRDVCTDGVVGGGESISSGIFAEQLKEDVKVQTAQTLPCGDSKEAEDVERLNNVEEISKPEADSEGLAGKEGDANALPECQAVENNIPSSITIIRERDTNEQAEQVIGLGREVESTGQAQKDILSSSLSENVVGVVGADVGHEGIVMAVQSVIGVVGADVNDEGITMAVQKDVVGENVVGVVGADVGHEGIVMTVQNVIGVVGMDVSDEGIAMAVQKDVVGVVDADAGFQERSMAVQQDIETLEEKQQLSFGVAEQEAQERVIALSKEVDFKALDMPSDGKDTADVPMSDGKDASEVLIVQAVDTDKGNVEVSDIVPTFNVSEGEMNLCRDAEEMATIEDEKDTDFLDEDNDIAYAEIDYSSDEQDASIEDDNGWSARSRNVGRYLKTVFEEMESSSKRLEQGPTLALERMLARKTKREAARMFFETLVLKTKDYIHVEQNVAYQDIHLYPRSKLMKTEF